MIVKILTLFIMGVLFFTIGNTNAENETAKIKPCLELKKEIAAKLNAAGVESYSLVIADNEQVENLSQDTTIIGTCDGGTKKIIYKKHTAPTNTEQEANCGECTEGMYKQQDMLYDPPESGL